MWPNVNPIKRFPIDDYEEIKININNENVEEEKHRENTILPPPWQRCIETLLPSNTQEYMSVKILFDETMEGQYTNLSIIKLTNNRTKFFFNQILNSLAHINKMNPDDMKLILFHGTKNTKPQDVYNGYDASFDPKYAGKGFWGNGTYFADSALYSANFAYKENGMSKILLANVIVGRYYDYGTTHNSDLTEPPMYKDPIKYNSVKGNVNNVDVHVIYTKNRAYPEYMIVYKDLR